MEEHKVIKITNRWLICITLFLVLITIGLVRYIVYKNTLFNKKIIYNTETVYKQEDPNNQEINSQLNPVQIKSYSTKVIVKPQSEKEYKIGDNFNIWIKVNSINDNIVNYSFKINNSDYLHSDTITLKEDEESFTLTLYKLGNYFVFENSEKSDFRDTNIYIFNKSGNLYNDLNPIDNEEDRDMYINNMSFTENELLIDTTRLMEDYRIIYNGKILDLSEVDSNTIPDDVPLKAQYRYNVNRSGNVDFTNPDKIILETIGDFRKRNN